VGTVHGACSTRALSGVIGSYSTGSPVARSTNQARSPAATVATLVFRPARPRRSSGWPIASAAYFKLALASRPAFRPWKHALY
jgi:hypothetical protein